MIDFFFGPIKKGIVQAAEFLWLGALQILRFGLTIATELSYPDLSPSGPVGIAVGISLSIAITLSGVLFMAQVTKGFATNNYATLGKALVGPVQFVVAWFVMSALSAGIVAGSKSLNTGIIDSSISANRLLSEGHFDDIDPSFMEAGSLFALSIAAIFVLFAGLVHVIVALGTHLAILLTFTTIPISAAGLIFDATRQWFLRNLQFFFGAVMLGPATSLSVALAISIARGAAAAADASLSSVGSIFVAALCIFFAVVAPLVLFKYFAFAQPNASWGHDLGTVVASIKHAITAESHNTSASSVRSDGTSHGEHMHQDGAEDRFAALSRRVPSPIRSGASQAVRALRKIKVVDDFAAAAAPAARQAGHMARKAGHVADVAGKAVKRVSETADRMNNVASAVAHGVVASGNAAGVGHQVTPPDIRRAPEGGRRNHVIPDGSDPNYGSPTEHIPQELPGPSTDPIGSSQGMMASQMPENSTSVKSPASAAHVAAKAAQKGAAGLSTAAAMVAKTPAGAAAAMAAGVVSQAAGLAAEHTAPKPVDLGGGRVPGPTGTSPVTPATSGPTGGPTPTSTTPTPAQHASAAPTPAPEGNTPANTTPVDLGGDRAPIPLSRRARRAQNSAPPISNIHKKRTQRRSA